MRQLYNQVPQTAWVRSSYSWSQLGTRCLCESQWQTEGFGPSVTHGWATQPRWERSSAMVRRTLGQYIAVCPHLQLTSHAQPTSTLPRIKCERYTFIKKCVRSFIEVRHYVWLYFRLYLIMFLLIFDYVWLCFRLYMYMRSIKHIHIWCLMLVYALMAYFRTWIKPRRSRKRLISTHQEN